jgi:hypothetical protein
MIAPGAEAYGLQGTAAGKSTPQKYETHGKALALNLDGSQYRRGLPSEIRRAKKDACKTVVYLGVT